MSEEAGPCGAGPAVGDDSGGGSRKNREVAAGPVAVLEAAGAKFREYERHHRGEYEREEHVSRKADRRAKAEVNRAMAEACERALADLQALMTAAGKREVAPAVSEDDRRRVFEIGYSAGCARAEYLVAAQSEDGWPDDRPPPPEMSEAWAVLAAAIARGGARG